MSELNHLKHLKREALSELLRQSPNLRSLDPNEARTARETFKNMSQLLPALSKEIDGATTLGKLMSSPGGRLASSVATGVGGAAAALGGSHLLDAYHNRERPINTQMLEVIVRERPSLQSVDKELLTRYYGVMNRVAPTIAGDSIVAGSLLERIVNYGGIDHSLMKDLADSERALKESRGANIAHVGNLASFGKKVSLS